HPFSFPALSVTTPCEKHALPEDESPASAPRNVIEIIQIAMENFSSSDRSSQSPASAAALKSAARPRETRLFIVPQGQPTLRAAVSYESPSSATSARASRWAGGSVAKSLATSFACTVQI